MKVDKHYVISRMCKNEIPLAIAWAKSEGWNPGLYDGECFYQADPNGFFVGKLDGKIIAMGSAVIYDDQFAFCGFYVVDPAYRAQGYGLVLTKARLAYIGARNAGIDGVMPMLLKYKRIGYKLAYNNARYCGIVPPIHRLKNQAITSLSNVNFTQLSDYDRLHFPARRDVFLKCWINQPGGKSLGYINDGKLLGYGVVRLCHEGFKIGPLFADNLSIANELFVQLANHTNGQIIYLDVPECNPHAVALVNRYQLEKVFETARMYLKEKPSVLIENIYGITSFELG